MYKFSKYNIPTRVGDNKVVFYNSLSGAKVILDNEHYSKVVDRSLLVSKQDSMFDFFYENAFIVDVDFDENDKLLQIEQKFASEEELTIIFVTTEQCNFRCVYCYENHVNKRIDDSVYDSVFKHIKQKTKLRSLSLSWFGGEPLLEYDSIVKFSRLLQKYCNENDISFCSSMTTNGFLLSKEKLYELLSCNVSSFQITVDGLPQEHNAKRPLVGGHGTFEQIWSNLKNFKTVSSDFNLIVRCNIDRDSDVYQFLDMFKSEFGGDSRIKLFLYAVGEWHSDEKQYFNKEEVSLSKYLLYCKKNGINELHLIDGENKEHSIYYVCYANKYNNIVVRASGDVSKCTIKLDAENNLVGQIGCDGSLSYNEYVKDWCQPQSAAKCDDCVVKPLCMSRYCPHNLCDATSLDCRKKLLRRIQNLDRIRYSEGELYEEKIV